MSIDEYINQENPVRMPKVILSEGEYTIDNIIECAGRKLKYITINKLWEVFKSRGYYIQVDNEECLRTEDEYGNPKNYSCFYV